MDIKKIKSFHTFLESGCNYRKSAALCSLTIPGLRKQLSSLESGLGVKLFMTEGKTTFPTRDAQILYEKSHRIISDYTDITHYFDNSENSIEKPMVVGTTVAIASLWLCDFLAPFIHENPRSHITIHSSDALPDLIKENMDVYIGPKLEDEQKAFNQHKLETYSMRLYASRAYIDTHGTPNSVEELHNHQVLGYGVRAMKPYKEVNWHLRLTDPPIVPFFNINSSGGLLRAVELGYGIGAISNLGSKAAKEKLVNVLPKQQGSDVSVYFSYPKFLESDVRVIRILKTLEKTVPAVL